MFKRITRTLQNIINSAVATVHPVLDHNKPKLTARDRAAYQRSLGGRGKASGAAQAKRASKKANNIRKFN